MRRSRSYPIFVGLCLVVFFGSIGCSQHSAKYREELYASGCEAWETTDMGMISAKKFAGLIYVEYTGGDKYPLEGAVISITDSPKKHTIKSDKEGHFSMLDLPEGNYRIEVCKEGFNAIVGSVTISKNAETDEFNLTTRLSN